MNPIEHEQDRREFWRNAYLAAAQAGKLPDQSILDADYALTMFDKKFPTAILPLNHKSGIHNL